MIDGLKITIDGSELRTLLQERIDAYRCREEHWQKLASDEDEQEEDVVQMPKHICENEAERCAWRADVLGFIHDRLDPSEVYRLSHTDLELGELLPAKPRWLEQEEYETAHPLHRCRGCH